MKNIIILLCFPFLSIAQTLSNNQQASAILEKSIIQMGNIPNSMLVSSKGIIHNLGHYETPEATKDIPLEETFAYFIDEDVYYLRTKIQKNSNAYVSVGISKKDSVYTSGYYDRDFKKIKMLDFSFDVTKTIPLKLLDFLQKNIKSLRLLENDNDSHYLLSFSYKNFDAITLYINKKSYLLDKIERLGYDNVYGNVVFMTEYKDYQDNHGIKMPKSRIDYEYNKPEREVVYQDIKLNIKPDTTNLKIRWVPQSFKTKLLQSNDISEKIIFSSITENIDLIKIESQNNKMLIAQLSDGLALFETPAGIALNNQILQELQRRYPNKPLKYIFLTHHHPDHAGGIRAYANLPVTIITTKGNESYFNTLVNANHTFSDIKMMMKNKILTFEFVPLAGEKIWKDTKNEIRAFEIGKNTTHTNEHLIYYFPQSGILWTGDLLFLNADGKIMPAGQRGKSVFNLLCEKNLSINKIYTSWPLHGQKEFILFDELKKSVEETK